MLHIGNYCLDIELVVNILIAITAAYFAYRLGLRAYFKQKEFENVRARYLDNGVERVIAQVDYALAIYRHNWALMLRFTRQFRELEEHVLLDDFLHQFRELDQESFQLAPAYKLKTMFQSDITWSAYQSVFSFVGTTNDKIKTDFYGVLKHIIENPDTSDKAGFIKEVEKFSEESSAEAGKYYIIINVLHELTELLEKNKYTIKSMHNLKYSKEIQKLETTLTEHFSDEEDAQQENPADAKSSAAD